MHPIDTVLQSCSTATASAATFHALLKAKHLPPTQQSYRHQTTFKYS